MPTIFDVAKAANVSIASVSLVMRDPKSPRVGDKKRVAILRAAQELGYTPNLLARGLGRHGTGILGLVVPMADPRYFFNLTISEILAGIQACLTEHSCHLLVYSHRSERGRITQAEIVQSKATDGLIFINTRVSTKADIDATIAELQTERIPFVMINSAQEYTGINYVGVDDVEAGNMAAEYLIGKGHRRIGMVGGASNTPTAELLQRGVRGALARHDLPAIEAWFASGAFEEARTREAVQLILKEQTRPTALFCTSDLMVPYVYEALGSAGLRIPDDMAVVGRGDLMFAKFLSPALTTVASPFYDIGHRSTELLIGSVRKRDAVPKRVLLAPALVERKSA